MNIWRRKVARAYIFDKDKKLFLIAKSSLPPYTYHLPGGGIDRKETGKDALLRELGEELNILPHNVISISFLSKVHTSVLYIPHEMDIFLVTVRDVDIKLSWEIYSVVWVAFEDLHTFLDRDSITVLTLVQESMV